MGDPLPRTFYDRDPVLVARELLGKTLVRRTAAGQCTGRIVETEAYLAAGDTSSHSHRGQTRKNATMFGPPGFLYVYSIHSRYCMNVVTEGEGVASAILLRAVEPLEGVALMQRRRGHSKLLDLTRGPARLCEAFDVDRTMDGWDLTSGTRIWLTESTADETARTTIEVSRRIGVTSAHDLMLRFFHSNCRFVSGRRSARETASGSSGCE
jgi:DNA-3-methyladenine glycosylase